MLYYRLIIWGCILAIFAIIIWPNNAEASIEVYDNDTQVRLPVYENYIDSSKIKVDYFRAFIDSDNKVEMCSDNAPGGTMEVITTMEDGSIVYTGLICIWKGKWQIPASRKLVFFTQLGYIYNDMSISKTKRAAFREITHSRGNTGRKIAEAFSWCATKPPSGWYKGSKNKFWAYWPTEKQHKQVCQEIFGVQI